MKRLIFSIYVDIPEDKLDNPGSWDNTTGKVIDTDKSKRTKEKFLKWKDRLIRRQREYAKSCHADYIIYDNLKDYEQFADWFTKNAPQISYYDIINFYKHYLMYINSFAYDEICYFDLDVVPLTKESVFKNFDFGKFNVGDSNVQAALGREMDLEYYNLCIRAPTSKYFNAQAMAIDLEIEPIEDVFNTGIMFANWHIIQSLNYFSGFRDNLQLMTDLIEEKDSLYPHVIRRSFGFDNETLFAHRVNVSNIPYAILPQEWNTTNVLDCENAKLCHVISKEFEYVL